MSCGPSEGLLKLADKIESANTALDSAINGVVSGAVGGLKATILAQVSAVKASLKSMIPEIDFPKIPDSLQNDIISFAQKLIVTKLAGEALQNELTNLKTKWSGVDLGDLDLNDLPNLLRSGAFDLANICKIIPNYELDGAELILKGTPASFPEIDAAAIIRGHRLPELPKPSLTVDVERRRREAGERFLNIVPPSLYTEL